MFSAPPNRPPYVQRTPPARILGLPKRARERLHRRRIAKVSIRRADSWPPKARVSGCTDAGSRKFQSAARILGLPKQIQKLRDEFDQKVSIRRADSWPPKAKI
jgi:hypothetical protein